MPKQLPLPLASRPQFKREDFVSSLASAPALAFIDSWPNWNVPATALHGPPGSGKSHLAAIWQAKSEAQCISAAELHIASFSSSPVVIEDVDSVEPTSERDAAIFAALERATLQKPVLLTGCEPPSAWKTTLPDLASRFSAVLSFPLWAPDDELLAAIARKLFNDRQLGVPDAVIERIVRSLERSPAAIRDFIARADERALAEGRAVNLALVRDLLAEADLSSP